MRHVALWRKAQLKGAILLRNSVEGVLRASVQQLLKEVLGPSMAKSIYVTSKKLQPQLDSGYGDPSPKVAVDLVVLKNHQHLDLQICCLSKLTAVLDLSELVLDLNNRWLCTRLPMVRSVAVGRLRGSFTTNPTFAAKLGGNDAFWSKKVNAVKNQLHFGRHSQHIQVAAVVPQLRSVLGVVRHPTKGNIRAILPSVPTVDEIGDEDEFQAAAFSSALAPSSSNKYSAAFLQFQEYLKRHGILIDMTADQVELISLLHHWFRRFLLSEGGVSGLSYSSLKGKAYGIRWHYLVNYDFDLLESWSNHRVFMRGVKRLRHHPKRKLPLSWALLLLIISDLDLFDLRHLVIAAALLLGWFFGTRISELLAFRLCSVIFFDLNGRPLSFNDPLLVDHAVELELKFGKTKADQDGEGAVRSHYATGEVLCCVKSCATMVAARYLAGGDTSPYSLLFQFFDSSPDSVREKVLGRELVTRTLKAGAASAGIPEARFSCHSLRSGGATAMLRCSQSYEDTRCFFRWRSDVTRVYLRSVRGAMRNVSCLMAAGSGMDTVILAGN